MCNTAFIHFLLRNSQTNAVENVSDLRDGLAGKDAANYNQRAFGPLNLDDVRRELTTARVCLTSTGALWHALTKNVPI